MGFLEELQEIEFLGGEFAAWLVVESACGRGPEDWGDCHPAVIEIPGPILLEGPGRGAAQVNVRGDDVLEAPELRSALSEGKKVRRCKLHITLEEETWDGTLDAKTLEWRGVKVSVPPVPDLGEYGFMRTQAFERLTGMLDEWFAAFLRRRMDAGQWDAAIAVIREFAAGRKDGNKK